MLTSARLTKDDHAAMAPTAFAPAYHPGRVYFVMGAGIVAVSLAAIFIRFAQAEGMPSLLIAAGRLTLSALILTPFTLRRHLPDLRAMRGGDYLLAAASGLLLAVHFVTWIASLEYTSVLISVVFVSTSPLWVALLEFVFLRARLKPPVVFGLLIAVMGGALIGAAGGDAGGAGSDPALGAGLALVGAIAIAIYLVVGRKLRARLPLLPYIWLVYGCAALFTILMVLLSRTPIAGYSTSSYFWIVLLALVPQLIGHTSFNYALRYLSATYISIAAQLEPIGSAFVAFLVFGEIPLPLQMVGSAAIIVGVALATFGQSRAGSKAGQPRAREKPR
jgi:drug/metabolite transporter (DMT)-like permease